MTITKGFLARPIQFSQARLTSGLILWVAYSYILYAFFYFCREILRFFSGVLGDQMLLVLNERETFIYNLFCASLAAAIGYGLALKFVLQNSVFGQTARARALIRRTLNDQDFFTWAFLSWFSRLATVLGICYMMLPMEWDIDFLDEFPLLLFLLPVSVFFSTWPKLTQIIKGYRFQWLAASSGLFVILSFGFAFHNFVSIDKVNGNLLKKSIEYSYGLKVPRSRTHQRIERISLVTNVYVVQDTIAPFQPLIFVNDIYNSVGLDSVGRTLNVEREKLFELERSLMIVNLHIDENVAMTFVEELKYRLRRDSISLLQYSTGIKHSKYPSNYPAWKYSGIQQRLYPKYYPQFEAFLDSAERLDFGRYSIRVPQSVMYRVNTLNEYNRIEVYVSSNGATVNGTPMSDAKLGQTVYSFTKKYSPNCVIIFTKDDQITFGRYIEYLDLIYSQVDKLRNEMSLARYGKPFDYWYWEPELDSIKAKYPRNVLEWTREEKRLIEVMKKAGITSVK